MPAPTAQRAVQLTQARRADSDFVGLGRWRLVATGLLIASVTVVLVGALIGAMSGSLAVDFRLHYLPAADAVLQGKSPYDVAGYVYPPQLAFALTPLAMLPDDIAALLALVGVGALLVSTLAVLGVRDRLCYVAMFAWAPVWHAFDMASITVVLAFGLALVWRYRDDARRSGIAAGLIVSAKLFLWPVLVWAWSTGRARSTVWAVVVGTSITVTLWAVLGFDGLVDYPGTLQSLSEANGSRGHSIVAVASSVGLGDASAHLLLIGTGALLLVGCVLLGRQGNEQGAFVLAIVAAFSITPILWLHYFALLIVPLAIARPRFSWLWLLPAVLWITPNPMDPPTALPLLVTAVIVAACNGWTPAMQWTVNLVAARCHIGGTPVRDSAASTARTTT